MGKDNMRIKAEKTIEFAASSKVITFFPCCLARLTLTFFRTSL